MLVVLVVQVLERDVAVEGASWAAKVKAIERWWW